MWVLALYQGYPQWMSDCQLITIILCLAEGLRRAQWAILRLENEHVNNFEKYRTIQEIPAVKEDD